MWSIFLLFSLVSPAFSIMDFSSHREVLDIYKKQLYESSDAYRRRVVKRSTVDHGCRNHYVIAGYIKCLENGTQWFVKENETNKWQEVCYGHKWNNYEDENPAFVRAEDSKWYKLDFDNLSLIIKEALSMYPTYKGRDSFHISEIDVPRTTTECGSTEETDSAGAANLNTTTHTSKTHEETTQPGDDDIDPKYIERLDLRVGRIINVTIHPWFDYLYVEHIDIGGGEIVTAVNNLGKLEPVEQLKDRMVVVLYNVKRIEVEGVMAEVIVMTAVSPDTEEILLPPPRSEAGDLIQIVGFARRPHLELQFREVADDLRTDMEKIATYKGMPLMLPGKGVVTTKSLKNAMIR